MENTLNSDAVDVSLTPRELEILALLAEGHQKKEIANNLQIGLETVNTHIKSTDLKLDVVDALQPSVSITER
jgi:DNA-binding CsgD family transcriptional regulator